MKIQHLLPLLAIIAASCSNSDSWSVKGTLEGADSDAKIILEGFNNQSWYVIDTLHVADGKFAYTSPAPADYPDIYRLTFDGKSIYFPIDSIDNLDIKAVAANFNRGYSISGSDNAVAVMRIDQRIDSIVDAAGVSAALTDTALKNWLNEIILADTVGTVSYYAINKTVGGQPLYSPANKRDVGIVGAVAQKFVDRRPTDPRTPFIKKLAIERRRAISAPTALPEGIEVSETGHFEIALPDEAGKVQSLNSAIAKGKVVVLSFTNYDMEASTAYNVALNTLLSDLGAANVEIFQVGIANDELSWRQSAKNIPWTTVWSSPAESTKLMQQYNFAVLPTTYIINRQGEIVERVDFPNDLKKSVSKHI